MQEIDEEVLTIRACEINRFFPLGGISLTLRITVSERASDLALVRNVVYH